PSAFRDDGGVQCQPQTKTFRRPRRGANPLPWFRGAGNQPGAPRWLAATFPYRRETSTIPRAAFLLLAVTSSPRGARFHTGPQTREAWETLPASSAVPD